MSGYRTDLAMEAREMHAGELPGVTSDNFEEDGVRVTRVYVEPGRGARVLGKEPGSYITLESGELTRCEPHRLPVLAGRIAAEIGRLMRGIAPDAPVLVVGLGNRYVTPDALGPRAAERVLVTRQLLAQGFAVGLRPVCALSPGVAGVTGVDAQDVVAGLCQRLRPAAVIAIDALAARDARRILATVQIADTGISPGSGVGNRRAGLTYQSLGVPVFAVGVPMVVYASTLARDVLQALVSSMEGAAPPNGDMHNMLTAFGEQDLDQLLSGAAREELGDLVVAPREIDEAVVASASAVALGINMALNPSLSAEDILVLTS